MKVNNTIVEALEKVVRERFATDHIAEVEIASVEVDEVEGVIRIVLNVHASSEPSKVASKYFGLTSRVRKELGDEWRNFFPVITPVIDQKACA